MRAEQLRLPAHGGVSLAADALGDPEADPVLLFHGGGQTRHAWGGTAEALAREGWYAVSVDLRGHGDSDWCDDGRYELTAFAEDVRRVAERFSGRARPVLVGASLGGMASLVAEAELAEDGLAAALVLVDIAPRIEPEGASRIVGFMTGRPEGFASLEEAADAIAEFLPNRGRPRDLSGLRKNLRRGADGRWRWHWDPRFLTRVGSESKVVQPDRLRAAARRLRVPTLLVRGRLSDILSEEGAREFLRLAPHARYADVSQAGHMVAGDRNDRFTEAVARFLREDVRGDPAAAGEASGTVSA